MKRFSVALGVLLVPVVGCGEDVPEGSAGQMTANTFGETTGVESSGESGGSGMDTTTTGDGDVTSDDGDGTNSGDGDGTSSGDGDGTSSGDGDGTSSGDGDGTSSGDGDGTSSGDGDGTSGDGDGTSGDGTSGDGDGTSGDGDGTSGDGTSGDGTSGDGDGTTTTGDGDGDDGCFNDEFSFNGVPPSIMLVLDQSGSMTITYDHDNNAGTANVSRWNALHIALTSILTAYDSSADFGVQLFPNDGSCGVSATPEVPIAAMNATNILSTIPAATFSPTGSTPSGSGLQAALDYLTPYPAVGEKAIIFMADGGTSTSCTGPNQQSDITSMLSAAFSGTPSIPTYVVGINASGSTASELDLFAAAGGVPQNQAPGTVMWTDGFETGNLSGAAWSLGGTGQWVVDTSDAASGSFSAHSPTLGNSQSSDLIVNVNMAQAGWVIFQKKTDTEAGFDDLQILVDGAILGEWSGLGGGWSPGSAPIPAGNHTLTFRFYKDGSVSSGQDRVWLDDVRIEEGGQYGSGFYDAQDTAGLFMALDQIVGSLVTCNLILNPPPPDPDQVEVALMGMVLPKLDPAAPGFDCAVDYGWYYSSLNVVTMCGQACTDFENMAVPTADVTYFCMAS